MKQEEKLLTEICKSYLNGTRPSPGADIDYDYLYRLAAHHNLLGVCHCALYDIKGLPDGFLGRLKEAFEEYIFAYQCQNNVKALLSQLLGDSQIRHIFFKGAVLRELYPLPEARAMGDIDILIDEKNRDRVKTLLTENGFQCIAQNGQVYDYVRDNVLIEMHTALTSEFGENLFCRAFEFSGGAGCCKVLNADFHLAYMIAHTANHLKYTGAGIRFVLDLAVWQSKNKIDFDTLFAMLEEINLCKFGRALLSVCAKWFGVGRDFGIDTRKLEEYLVSDGVFGSLKDSRDTTVSRLIQLQALNEDSNGTKSAFALKLQLAFPSYAALRKASYIRFLDGRPYLLPLAWIYRVFYNLKHRRQHMLQTIRNIDDEETASLAKEELKFFEEIGLK